jgi:hypothetical protein
MTEEEYIAKYFGAPDSPNAVVAQVSVPSEEQSSNEPVISIQVASIRVTVKELKEQICLYLNKYRDSASALASNKIQLKDLASGFLKDTQTLAFYNLCGFVSLELSLRSRGGKK